MFYDILPRTPNEEKQDFNQQYIRTVRKSLLFFFTLGSLSTEDRHSNKFRLATLQVYHAVLIQSEGKYELEWLKQFNADMDGRFI